ncbi:MAG: hypothetical protein HY865_05840 [Chloroflexi bacterium]|nr:hypothetical protein [Chloroflexota bacterium]
MNKKLYRVRVVLFVMAENESDACVAATRAGFECTARKAKNIDPEWRDAIPYNSDDERICSEILASEILAIKRHAIRSRPYPIKPPQYIKAAPSGSSMPVIAPPCLDSSSKNLDISQRLAQ